MNATGGLWRVAVRVGAQMGTSPAIAADATAEQVESALKAATYMTMNGPVAVLTCNPDVGKIDHGGGLSERGDYWAFVSWEWDSVIVRCRSPC